MGKQTNPVIYFEIPVNQMERAVAFYKNVFNFEFQFEQIDKINMALFPFNDRYSGITGALAQGDIYKPTNDGVVLYFSVEEINKTLELANNMGARTLYPVTDNGIGWVAEFEDSEGNRIALFQAYNEQHNLE